MNERMISADGHVVEPLEVFAGVAKRYLKTEPALVCTDDRGWILDSGLGRTFQPGRYATAGLEPQTPAYGAQERSGYERASLTDPIARARDMDQDGVEAEILYPTIVGSFLSGRKAGLEATVSLCRSYNDWIRDYSKACPGRFYPLACVPVADVDVAVAEAERAKKNGHVGIVVPCGSAGDRPYTDPVYDKLWAAVQALGLPVAFHAGFGSDRALKAESFGRHGLRFSLRHVSAAITTSDLINTGACQRFPDIRFVFAEYGTGWIACFLANMEQRQKRSGKAGRSGSRFRHYWRKNFRVTFEDDTVGIGTRHQIGVDNLMWASDYPHGDSIWPNSRSTVQRIMSDCTPAERRAMMARNVATLYELPGNW